MFRQYWNAKKENFDKVILFRCGRWLNAFYQDALLIGKMFGNRVGFWGKDRPAIVVYESQYPIYMRTLLEGGHRVMIIEQIEKGELTQKEEGQITKREIT